MRFRILFSFFSFTLICMCLAPCSYSLNIPDSCPVKSSISSMFFLVPLPLFCMKLHTLFKLGQNTIYLCFPLFCFRHCIMCLRFVSQPRVECLHERFSFPSKRNVQFANTLGTDTSQSWQIDLELSFMLKTSSVS